MGKRTTLYDKHVAAGARMVAFAGYDMPVQYPAGVIAEHMATRQAAGLFDVSHMGEFTLAGEGALDALQLLLTNDMAGMAVGDCRYSPMCNEAGGTVDDLIVYRTGRDAYMLVVNAANREKDASFIRAHLPAGAAFQDVSDDWAEIALQGPKALHILQRLVAADKLPAKYYTFVEGVQVSGVACMVSRTGYTGEDGFELYCAAQDAPVLWDALLAAGQADGLVPCGLGARDTLRLEAGMPLYGHEMNDEISPLEAGLGFFVKMDKPNFIGKEALLLKGAPTRRRTGLRMTGRGIAREGAEVLAGDKPVGVVTSGTMLPALGYAGAMALLDTDARDVGIAVTVVVRGRPIEAQVVKLPFYKRESK